jgi:hypothetical protein
MDKPHLQIWEAGQNERFRESRVKSLIGDAVPVKNHLISIPDRDLLGPDTARPKGHQPGHHQSPEDPIHAPALPSREVRDNQIHVGSVPAFSAVFPTMLDEVNLGREDDDQPCCVILHFL